MIINEVYASLQGEGLTAGCPTVFIRTQGCSLRCTWCLLGTTKLFVRLGNSTFKKCIKDIKEGDLVLSYDGEKCVWKPVLHIMSRQTDTILRVSTTSQYREVFTTPEHPFFVKGQWKEAKDLEPGDEIYGLDNKAVQTILQAGELNAIHSVASEELSARAKRTHTGRQHSIEHRRKNSEAKLKKNPMKDPEVVKKNVQAHFRGEPSGPEQVILKLIAQHGLPFNYTGNNSVAIGSKETRYKFPDFVHLTEPKVIEVYDSSFHYRDNVSSSGIRDEHWKETKRDHYSKFGYQTLFIDFAQKSSKEDLAKQLGIFAYNGYAVTSVTELHPGDNSLCPMGIERGDLMTVYNLEVEGTNCYFANGLLSHNCDTPYGLPFAAGADNGGKGEGFTKTVAEVVAEVVNCGPQFKYVCLTGGDPLQQKHEEVKELLTHLNNAGYKIVIETGGHIRVDSFVEHIRKSGMTEDQVTLCVDYKLPKSGMQKRMVSNAFLSLRPHDSIKLVVADLEDFNAAISFLESIREKKVQAIVLFSPVWGSEWGILGLSQTLISNKEIAHLHPYRLSLQIHKVIWDPGTRKT